MKKHQSDDYNFTYYDSRYLSIEETDFSQVTTLISRKSVLKNERDLTIGIDETTSNIVEKIAKKSTTINMICTEVACGISSGADDVFKIPAAVATQFNIENSLLNPCIVGGDVFSYCKVETSDVIVYTTRGMDIDNYPNAKAYLSQFKDRLDQRSETKSGVLPWWCINRSRNKPLFEGKKIILRQTSDRIIATIDENNLFTLDSLLIVRLINECDYEFVLGVMNSNIGIYIYKNVSQEEGRTFAQVKPQNVRKLFIPNKTDIKETISNLVRECLTIKSLDANGDINSQLESINAALYQYYELTDEEINLIEKEIDY